MSEGEQYVMLVRFIRWAVRGNVAACHECQTERNAGLLLVCEECKELDGLQKGDELAGLPGVRQELAGLDSLLPATPHNAARWWRPFRGTAPTRPKTPSTCS